MEWKAKEITSGKPQDRRFVFVGDIDNLSHKGAGDRGFLDIPSFVELLRERGVTEGIVVANRFSHLEARLWEGAGFDCVATACNADDRIAAIISEKVAEGADRILIGSGDGRAFLMLVRRLVVKGVKVHVLASRNRLSSALAKAATGYAYSDRYVYRPVAEAA